MNNMYFKQFGFRITDNSNVSRVYRFKNWRELYKAILKHERRHDVIKIERVVRWHNKLLSTYGHWQIYYDESNTNHSDL